MDGRILGRSVVASSEETVGNYVSSYKAKRAATKPAAPKTVAAIGAFAKAALPVAVGTAVLSVEEAGNIQVSHEPGEEQTTSRYNIPSAFVATAVLKAELVAPEEAEEPEVAALVVVAAASVVEASVVEASESVWTGRLAVALQ